MKTIVLALLFLQLGLSSMTTDYGIDGNWGIYVGTFAICGACTQP